MSHPRAFQHTGKRGQGKVCCHLEATNQQGSGAGSTTAHKGSAASELRALSRDGGLNKRRLDQAFQTRKSSNNQMFRERKMKGSNEHNEAFHAVRYSGMSHSFICDAAALDLSCFLHTLRSLSTDEGSSKCCPDLPGALPWPIQATEYPSTG